MGNAAEQVGSAGRIRIRKIEVEGLCGRFHHSIELNEAERVSILFGPNGVGKTAILRLVDAFFSLNAYAMERVPFSALRVTLAAGNQDPERVWEVVPIGILGVEGSSYQVRFVVDGESRRELLWMPEQAGDELGDWFGDDGGPSTHFIATTRLRDWVDTMDFPTDLEYSVSCDARDLARRFELIAARFGRESQALEQTFPQRLLRMGNGETVLDSASLRERIAALDLRRGELERLGLLQSVTGAPIDPGDFDGLEATEKKVLTLYVEDSEKKLQIFQDLAARIRLFLDFVNRKFRHKEIVIDPKRGFLPVDRDGKPLDLETLSSGEQHELVLLYDLLFRVEPDTLVLIDEPEISLHLAWQREFLPELLEIVKVARFDALIATHSPFIVGDRSDLMIPLSDEI